MYCLNEIMKSRKDIEACENALKTHLKEHSTHISEEDKHAIERLLGALEALWIGW